MAVRHYRPGSSVFTDVIRATEALTKKAVIDTAWREHRKILQTDPRPGRWRQYVDGVEGAPFEAVRGNGVIVVDYQRLDIVAQFAMETLFDLSPVDSGDYRKAHTLFVDDTAVTNLKDWEVGQEVSIANFLPYSRKIELGVMKMRVPGTDHVYQQAEQIVRRRFGNIADIRFTYRAVVSGNIIPYQGSGSANADWSRPGGIERDNRMPALVLNDGRSPARRRRR